jgi:hypothetical protein
VGCRDVYRTFTPHVKFLSMYSLYMRIADSLGRRQLPPEGEAQPRG